MNTTTNESTTGTNSTFASFANGQAFNSHTNRREAWNAQRVEMTVIAKRLLAEGESLGDIAKNLNSCGYRTFVNSKISAGNVWHLVNDYKTVAQRRANNTKRTNTSTPVVKTTAYNANFVQLVVNDASLSYAEKIAIVKVVMGNFSNR